jgi:hypothetical protein
MNVAESHTPQNHSARSCHLIGVRIGQVIMSDVDVFLDLPVSAQLAVICFSFCATSLFAILMCAPRRNCFFLKWRMETRFLALFLSPLLLLGWPIVLYGLFLRSRGIRAYDPDFLDE